MIHTAAEVRAARAYLAGLTDDRAVQVHRWLDKRNGLPPEETEGQITLDAALDQVPPPPRRRRRRRRRVARR